MSHFQNALVAEAVDGGWRLHAPLVYYSDVLGAHRDRACGVLHGFGECT